MEILDLANKLRSIDFMKLVDECFNELMPEIIELNKDQLLGGKTKDEVNISPNYYTDPYFPHKTPNGGTITAKGYAIWKDRLAKDGLIPTSKKYNKSFTSPNFYIQGTYHSNIVGAVLDQYLLIGANGFGSDFDQKWKNIYGLTPENMDIIIPKLFNKLTKKFRDAIGI